MNWEKVGSGTLLAGVVLWLLEIARYAAPVWFYTHRLPMEMMSLKVLFLLLVPCLIRGFIITWLYVLARPRLGPGPRTAVIMGSLVWLIDISTPAFWFHGGVVLHRFLFFFFYPWVATIAATYLAGWQYIEKAP